MFCSTKYVYEKSLITKENIMNLRIKYFIKNAKDVLKFAVAIIRIQK